MIKVAPRVEKTGVFRKDWNFCKSDLFWELHNEKTLFSIMDERHSVCSLFLPWNYCLRHWAIWFRSQLYILLEHLYIFKHKHKSNIKGAIFELRSSHLFRDQPYKEVLEVKCQACNFTGVSSFTGHIFPTCFFAELLIT